MAYSGKTTNYNLPQIEGTDKVNWFDLNGAFETIDTGMESNKQEAATANQKADNNTNAIAALTETVTKQGQTGEDNTAEIEKLKQTTSLHTTHLNEIDVINQNQTTRIQALESEESETGTEIVQIKKDLTEVSTAAATNAQNIAAANTEIQSLQQLTDSMQDDLVDSVKTGETSRDASITSIKYRISSTDNDIAIKAQNKLIERVLYPGGLAEYIYVLSVDVTQTGPRLLMVNPNDVIVINLNHVFNANEMIKVSLNISTNNKIYQQEISTSLQYDAENVLTFTVPETMLPTHITLKIVEDFSA